MDLLDVLFTPSVETFTSHEEFIRLAHLAKEPRGSRKRVRSGSFKDDGVASRDLVAGHACKKRSALSVFLGSWEDVPLQVLNSGFGSLRCVSETRASLQVVRGQLRLAVYADEQDDSKGQWVASIPDDWSLGFGGLLRQCLTASQIKVTNVTIKKPSFVLSQYLVGLDVFIEDSALSYGMNGEPADPLLVWKRKPTSLNSLQELLLRGVQLPNASVMVSPDIDDFYKATVGYYEYEATFDDANGILESLRANLSAPGIDVPSGIRGALLPFQRQTLKWMREQERYRASSEHYCHPHWTPIDTSDGFRFYSHEYHQALSKHKFPPPVLQPGGCLFSESGLGKTLQYDLVTFNSNNRIISLVALNPLEASVNLSKIQTISEKRLIKGTLVVVPTCLAHHWLTECQKHSTLKTAFYSGDVSWSTLMENRLIRPYAEFAFSDYDIVVTTTDVLRQEGRLTTQARTSPLLQVRWWRFVLDDAHILLNLKKAALLLLSCVSRQNTWAVSGDPAVSNAMDFYPYVAFITQDHFMDISEFKISVAEPFDKKDGYAQFRIMGLLRRLCWRQAYAHQLEDISMPSFEEEEIRVRFSSIEQAMYDELKFKVRKELKKMRKKAGLFNEITASRAFQQKFYALRQICDHYQINDCLGYGKERMTVEHIFRKFVQDKMAEISALGDKLVESAVYLGCVCVVKQLKTFDGMYNHLRIENVALLELLRSAMSVVDDTIIQTIESAKSKSQEQRREAQKKQFAKVLEIENIQTHLRQLLATSESTMFSVADQVIVKRTMTTKSKLQAQLDLNTTTKAKLLDSICNMNLPAFTYFTHVMIYGLLTRKYYLERMLNAKERNEDIDLDEMGVPTNEKVMSFLPEGVNYTLDLPCHTGWNDLHSQVAQYARKRSYGTLLEMSQVDQKHFSAEQGKLRYLRRQLAEHIKKVPQKHRPWASSNAPLNEKASVDYTLHTTTGGLSAESKTCLNETQNAEEAVQDGDNTISIHGERDNNAVAVVPATPQSSAIEESVEEEDMCLICQGPLTTIAMLPCAHQFCQECVDLFIESQQQNFTQPLCPQCRQPFTKRQLIRLDDNEEAFEVKDAVQGSYGTKISALVYDLVCRLGKDPSSKAVVFSAWVPMLRYVRSAIAEERIGVVDFTVSENDPFGPLTTFHKDPSLRVLLLPLRSKKEYFGLDLGFCNVVYFLEPSLNSSLETDALKVVCRLGQTIRPVQVVRLILDGTVEEYITKMMTYSDGDWASNEEKAKSDSENVQFGSLCDMFRLTTSWRYARDDLMSQMLDIDGGSKHAEKYKRKAAVEWDSTY